MVKINPDDALMCPSKIPTVSVTTDSFRLMNGSQSIDRELVIHVRVPTSEMSITCIKSEEGKLTFYIEIFSNNY